MESLTDQLVEEFLSEYSQSGTHDRDLIARLTRLALSADPTVAEPASRAIFALLVERLADSFEPYGAALYNSVFAQIIQICRNDSRAAALDRELAAFGLSSEETLIARAKTLKSMFLPTERRDLARSLKRVIVLSRVTLGADVAITSVILERLKHEFPASEIVLLGGRKTTELLGADPRLQFKELAYRRGGSLIERLLAWIDLLACVRKLTHGLNSDKYLIVDPDSRLTQLGLLPVTDHRGIAGSPNYLFFPSREYGAGTSLSLAELTCAWLDEVFGERAVTYPHVRLSQPDIESARKLASTLKGAGGRSIVAINFGIGENHLKRVVGEFESSIITQLLQRGCAVIFDKGAGDEEAKRADAVLGEAVRMDRDGPRARVIEIGAHNLTDVLNSDNSDADILVWNGRIGMLAALIGESDLYIGYDSAGQHIAAALGVPCIDVFAGSSSPRMLDRWKPTGRAGTRVVPVDTLARTPDTGEIVAITLRHADDLLKEPR